MYLDQNNIRELPLPACDKTQSELECLGLVVKQSFMLTPSERATLLNDIAFNFLFKHVK